MATVLKEKKRLFRNLANEDNNSVRLTINYKFSNIKKMFAFVFDHSKKKNCATQVFKNIYIIRGRRKNIFL